MKLHNAKVLITGGSLGIGKATAKVLVQSGAQVAITGRDSGRLGKAAAKTGAFTITADVSRPEEVARTYEEFLAKFNGLDCLINNAGIGSFKPMEDIEYEDFAHVFRVNVFGAALMAARAASIFKAQNGGNIVNIGSTAAEKGFERGTVYAASKFALRGMTQCWQAELRRHNIRVFLIDPSEVATAFANPAHVEKEAPANKLSSYEIAYAIKAVLEMPSRGMIPELSVWATNPW
ncbi:MAG: SDR family oxidoreductase [Candidatus Latescibacterota bacterium]